MSARDESLSPDPEVLKKDPMAEMFGPGSTVKLIGDAEDEVPDAVRAILDQHGLSEKSFQCILKELPDGSVVGENTSSLNSSYIKGWVRSIPSTEWIARTYGPGTYILFFMWRNKDLSTNGKSVAMHDEVTISISDKYLEEYKKHRLEAKLKQASDMSTKVRDALVEKKIESSLFDTLSPEEKKESVDPAQAAKAYITEALETARMLGLSPIAAQQQVPAKTIEWEKILPSLITGVTAFLQMQQTAAQQRQEDFNRMMMLVMSQGKESNAQLMEVLKIQSGVGSGASAFKEIKDMIFGAIDIKSALSGEQKESLSDKIFRIIESIAPQVLSIASTAADAMKVRQNPIMRKSIDNYTNTPEFAALKNNPAEMVKIVNKLDKYFGWGQTDAIITIAGIERPKECVRDPANKEPPENPDPDISDAEITTETTDAA